MVILKKLTFAPLFLVSFLTLIYLINPLFKSYDFVFSLALSTLIVLVKISLLIFLSSLLFIVLATIAQDWRISMPVAIIGSAVPFIFLDSSLAFVFAAGIFLSLLLSNLNLDVALKSYLNFQPSNLLGPPIRHLSGFLILIICIVYFFSASKIITQNGFQIPDSLIDTALQLTTSSLPNIQTEQANLPQITPEQLDLLRKNPELLRQSGLDPSMLESLTTPQKNQPPANLANNLIKQTVKDQIQNFIKPYISFVPVGLSILLFLTLQFFTSITNIFIYPLLWLLFLILEKTNFIKFETEQRTVRKMVV